jgi:FxsC-like protein
MPYFFFSYACANAVGKADAYVSKFFEDLEFEIRHKAQPPAVGEIGFRDWDTIVTGENWQQKLSSAVSTCKVFIPLYSPTYFTREACGKEWYAFTERLAEHAKRSANPLELPPLIMPVWWAPVDLQKFCLPPSITSLQYTFTHLGQEYEFGQKYEDQGLLQLLQLDDPDYKIFVTRFAKRMRDVCNAHALTDGQALAWNELSNAFQPAAAAPTAPAPDGPGHVEFLIAAGCAPQFAHVPARQACYGDRPENWRPYHPQFAKRIGPLVQGTAAAADLTSLLVDVGPGLSDRLKQAKKKQNIVVLIVDPWSLDVAGIAQQLGEYDELDLWNCTAFVTWNDDDEETQHKRSELKQRVAEIFENKTAPGRDTNTFRDDINSLKKLEGDLAEALVQIQQRVVERGKVMRKAEGERDIAISQVKGPGGTNPS